MKLLKFTKNTLLLLMRSEFTHLKYASTASKSVIDNTSSNDPIVEAQENIVESSYQSQSNPKRIIPLSTDEFKTLKALKPCQPENPHILKVSILGEPNVGKSTLTNALVKWKICSVSKKVHTTRQRASAILMEENKQIIFLDTPGFVTPEHSKKHNLEASFVMDPIKSVRDANLIAVVIDISNKWTNNKINSDVLEALNNFKDKTSILVLNKIDAMKSKNRLLSFVDILTEGVVGGMGTSAKKINQPKEVSLQEIFENTNKELMGDHHGKVKASPEQLSTEDIEQKRGWPLFSRVFMVSALRNDGVDDLREYLLNRAIPGNWMYHDTTVTDQHPHQIALMTVREKLLEYLPSEIPYHLDLRIKSWELLSTGCPKINIKIVCANSRHKRRVLGPAGKHITACADNSRRAMREAFRKDIVLKLSVE